MDNKDTDSKIPIYKLTSKEKVLDYYLSANNKKSATHESYNNPKFSENMSDLLISKINYINIFH